MAAVNIVLLLLSQYISTIALYNDASVIIDIDIAIDSPSAIAEHTKLANMVQSSFRHTNENAVYLITSIHSIQSIRNISYFDNDGIIQFHAIFNVYFTSKSQYELVLDQYRNEIFLDDESRRFFIKLFQSNLEQELSVDASRDSHDSTPRPLVMINALDMFQGNLIMNYHSMHYPMTSTKPPLSILSTEELTVQNVQNEEAKGNDTKDTARSFVEDNLSAILLIGGLTMLICLCGTVLCFCSSRHRDKMINRKHELQRRKWMDGAKTRVSGQSGCSDFDEDSEHNLNGDFDDSSCKLHGRRGRGPGSGDDPFRWDSEAVTSWLASQELDDFVEIIGGKNINGRDLLTMRLSIDTEYEEEVGTFVQNIKHLRLISEGYSRWKIRNDITSTSAENEYDYEAVDVMERKGLKAEGSYSSHSSADMRQGMEQRMEGSMRDERPSRKPPREVMKQRPSGHEYDRTVTSLNVDGSVIGSVSAASTMIVHDIVDTEPQSSVPAVSIQEHSVSSTVTDRIKQMNEIFNAGSGSGILDAKSPLSVSSFQIHE